MVEHPTLLLIDGSGYFFRAYHALPPLLGPVGQPTGAIYGVLQMLKKLLRDYEAVTQIAIVFDAGGKNFRHTLFPAYKMQRAKMPEELVAQKEPLFALLEAMGLPLLVEAGVEADDVIATLAMQAAAEGYRILIATSDKDMAQLVDTQVQLVHPVTQALIGVNEVHEKFGVPPDRIVDYLALSGDASDNVPGIPKVGPKTAIKWLETYGDLTGIMAHAHKITGQVGVNLRDNLSELAVFKQLVTVKTDVPLGHSLSALERKPMDMEKLRTLCVELGFNQWLAELAKAAEATQPMEPRDKVLAQNPTTYLLTEADFLQWKPYLVAAPYFAVELVYDVPEAGYNCSPVVGMALAVSERTAYLPLALPIADTEQAASVPLVWVLEQLCAVQRLGVKLVGYDLKRWEKLLLHCGLSSVVAGEDILLSVHLLEGVTNALEVEGLARRYLQKESITPVALTKEQLASWLLEHAQEIAVDRATMVLSLYEHFEALCKQKKPNLDLRPLLEQMEWPLVAILAAMEYRGVLIDKEALQRQTEELAKHLAVLSAEIYSLAGKEFNIQSPQQIAEVLFEDLLLPVLKKTPKGGPSTAEAVLEILAEEHRIAALILDFRAAAKLKSTYTEALPRQIAVDTGRVHTEYLQTGTITGRLASRNPNLQNIPIRTEAGRKIRQAFIAPEGKKLLSADYSQIELRLMAHFSQDVGLLSAFEKGEDIHAATASEIFSLPLALVTEAERRKAKAINFGLLYGMSAFGLAKQLNITQKQAQEYMDLYFARYPGIREYMVRICEFAKQTGYVETLFGRRLYYPALQARNLMQRKATERAVINAPLQGSAAEIIKRAMIGVEAWLQERSLDCVMIMQVHDELVFEVAEKDCEEAQLGIRSSMEQAACLSVSLVVEIGVGSNWDQAH